MKIFTCMFIFILTAGLLSFPAIAKDPAPIFCRDFHSQNVIMQIKTLNMQIPWNKDNCQMVITKSIFPKAQPNGDTHFTRGLQLFIYIDQRLKVICLPGWVCKRW